MVAPIDYMAFPPEFVGLCCGPVMRFCGLPLCDLRTAASAPDYPEGVRAGLDGTSRATREMRVPGVDFMPNADGSITPLCTPFLPPAQCCAAMASP